MSIHKRRPVVIAIRGDASADVITQKDLAELSALQGAVWKAGRSVHLAVERLRNRILHGATVEAGRLEFDHELAMVRRKKTG